MPDQEVTPDLRVCKVSRVFVVILDRKVTQVVKALREMSDLRDRLDQLGQQDLWDRKEISGFRGQEVFRDQPEQQVQLVLWDLKA